MTASLQNHQRLSLWASSLASAADTIHQQINAGIDDVTRTSSQIMWWGAYSELLSHVQVPQSLRLTVADSDTRRLRQATQSAPASTHQLRLMALTDLRRDAAGLEEAMKGMVARDLDTYLALQEKIALQFQQRPAVADESMDYIIQDFVLNRVSAADEAGVLQEAMRCLAKEGRLLSVVVVADEALTEPVTLRDGPQGPAIRIATEQALFSAFEKAGFHGICLHWSQSSNNLPALERIGSVDVRVCVIEAFKGKKGPCYELGQAVVYAGPWREVHDDDGHCYPRGARVAVCAKTFDLLMRDPYRGEFVGFRSVQEPPLAQAKLFDCNTPALRPPGVTKGVLPFDGAQASSPECTPGGGCC